GPLLAATDRFDLRIKGRGTHAAYPHLGNDPFVIGSQIVLAWQTIPARNIDPIDSAVVTVGFMKGGSAYNVIPDELHIGGTVRSFRAKVQDLIEQRMGEIARGTAALHGEEAKFAAEVAAEICGEDKVSTTIAPSMGGEDFSYMLQARPGAMLWLGN